MPWHVRLAPSGHEFDVPDGSTVLASGLAAGFALPYSCRTGTCTTCKARVASGTVEHGFVLESSLSAAERAEGYSLLCVAKPTSDLVVEVAELDMTPIEPKIYPCRLAKLERPAPDVAILTLRMPPNENMRFLAGQYVELITPSGARRNYSLANAPNPAGLPFIQLHVRHVPGGLFTEHLFTAAKERDLLRFEGPFGTFFLRESDKPAYFVASGTGFAPVKAIVDDALARGVTRPLTVYWGGRRRQDLYAPPGWDRRVTFVPVLSDPSDECAWTGRTGLVHAAVLADHPDLSGAQVYACGSPRMVDAARRDFTAAGLPPTELFADAFLTTADTARKETP